MKQMQCNALNIKIATKQVWLYFIRRTTRLGYAGTTTNLQIVLNTPKTPYLNQATPQKILAKFSYPKKSRNRKFQPQKILRSSPSLEIRNIPLEYPRWGPEQITHTWSQYQESNPGHIGGR